MSLLLHLARELAPPSLPPSLKGGGLPPSLGVGAAASHHTRAREEGIFAHVRAASIVGLVLLSDAGMGSRRHARSL
jgi:hypothetical protein